MDAATQVQEQKAVVAVISPVFTLRDHVKRCLSPNHFEVVAATHVQGVRERAGDLDLLAIDSEMLSHVGWRGRGLTEALAPDRVIPVIGLVLRDSHRPTEDRRDLATSGIVFLFEPFKALDLVVVISQLIKHSQRPS